MELIKTKLDMTSVKENIIKEEIVNMYAEGKYLLHSDSDYSLQFFFVYETVSNSDGGDRNKSFNCWKEYKLFFYP